MKSYQISFTTTEELRKSFDQINCYESNSLFYVTWTFESQKSVEEVFDLIKTRYPNATCYGTESSGNINRGKNERGINITVLEFEKPTTQVKLIYLDDNSKLKTIDDLCKECKNQEGLKAVELIPSADYLGRNALDNHEFDLDDDIVVFGGASINYDNPINTSFIYAEECGLSSTGMIAILYFGDELNVTADYVLGWKGLGRYMKIGKSDGRIIAEMDNQSPRDIYEKYLNLQNDENINFVFPLIMEEEGIEYIRIPQIFLPDGSMLMISNVPQNSTVRISYGDKNTILQEIYKKAEKMLGFYPQYIKSFSCAVRRFFWGDNDIEKETLPIENVAPVSGFYSGGEILRFNHKLRVLNATLVLVLFKEGEGNKDTGFVELPKSQLDTSVVSKLTYFAEKVVSEQEAQKEDLVKSLTLTEFFLNSYFSAYYVNLDTGSYQIYKRAIDYEDISTYSSNYVEMLTLAIENFIHPNDKEEVLKAIQPEFLKKEIKEKGEFVITFRDLSGEGEKFMRMQVIRGHDDSHVAIGLEDITETVRKEREIQTELKRALKEANSASVAKTNFLFNVSHDVRTPMNVIKGFTDIALEHLDDKAKVENSIKKIKEAGNLLLTLIDNVLDMSRIESGNDNIVLQKMDIYKSFDNIKPTLDEFANSKQISLNFAYENIEDRYVLADPNKCVRIFMNLITNSIKYTGKDGEISVICRQVGKENNKGIYQYIVSDNGIGMSEEFQAKMYEQFAREKNSTISGIQGTGLGLSLCKALAEAMDGTINCTSKQGKGTTFTLTIPFEIREMEEIDMPNYHDENESDSVIPVELKGKRILVVDDNELNLEITRDILEDDGFKVETANDGYVAVRLIDSNGPDYYDVVLMDIQMPMMNGYEATRRIRELQKNKHLPIIAVSANAFEEDKKKSLAMGMDDHIAKPINLDEFRRKIKKFLINK